MPDRPVVGVGVLILRAGKVLVGKRSVSQSLCKVMLSIMIQELLTKENISLGRGAMALESGPCLVVTWNWEKASSPAPFVRRWRRQA